MMCRSTYSRRPRAAEARAVRRQPPPALAPLPRQAAAGAEVAEEGRAVLRERRVRPLAHLPPAWVVAAAPQLRRLRACSDRSGW
jgi:hypothetical protein